MVAAWINAETGVGPSMASGNQMCSGNMADLPAPPMNISAIAQLSIEVPIKVEPMALPNTLAFPELRVLKSNVCV